MSGAVDLFMVYQFIKKLTTPFNKWDAYKEKVINADGDILVDKMNRTTKQKQAFSKFDLLVLNLKKIINKLPGGQKRTASYAAALWFIKENQEKGVDVLTEEKFEEYLKIVKEDNINERFESLLEEPTVSIGGGQIDGIGHGPNGEPGFTPSAMKKYKERNRKQARDRFRETWAMKVNEQ